MSSEGPAAFATKTVSLPSDLMARLPLYEAANGTEALSLGLRSNQLKQPSPLNSMGCVNQSGFQLVCAADGHATWWQACHH